MSQVTHMLMEGKEVVVYFGEQMRMLFSPIESPFLPLCISIVGIRCIRLQAFMGEEWHGVGSLILMDTTWNEPRICRCHLCPVRQREVARDWIEAIVLSEATVSKKRCSDADRYIHRVLTTDWWYLALLLEGKVPIYPATAYASANQSEGTTQQYWGEI